MNRTAARLPAYLFILLACVQVSAQNGDFDDVEIQAEAVTPGIYMLTGQGGNIGVSVGDDGVFIIDDQFAPLTEKILTAIAELSDKPVDFVINTHWHGDHSGGNENLAGEGARIVAHDNVRSRMSIENNSRFDGTTVPPSPAAALPVITYSQTMALHLNGNKVDIIHQENAHTDGDSIIYFREANVIHAGDLFFNGIYPFIDTNSKGSINGMIDGAKKMLGMANANTRIIPGHGPLASKQDLQTYHDMLVTYRANVKKLVDEGKSLDDIKKLKPNAALDEQYGQAFISPDFFVELVYESLN